MRANKILVCVLLALGVVSCTITKRLERNASRVRLSQPGAMTAREDTTAGTVPGLITYMDKEGNEHFVTRNEADSRTGEDISVVDLGGVVITARSKNVSERFGKVNLDFIVTVPEALISRKWQVRLQPLLYKRDEVIPLDKILLSGADFLKTQKRGYEMYQAFMSSIIPDSAYLRTLFDQRGYKKAMASLDEEFYRSWRDDLLLERQYIDWSDRMNKRYLVFNRKMERNRRNIGEDGPLISHLPSYWLFRDMDEAIVPGKYRMFLSGEYDFKRKEITPEDSARIAERFFDYRRMAENERKKELAETKFKEYVRFPMESARLDSVVKTGSDFKYYYQQEIVADEDIKRLDLTLDGRIVALDESTFGLPPSDTITYFISSMLQFADKTPRYKLRVVERKAEVGLISYISYKSGASAVDETLGDNKSELDKIFETIEKLTFSGELLMDSISMVASASPEGNSALNMSLSRARAEALKRYLSQRTDDKHGIDTLLSARWIGEDWERLRKKISSSEDIKNKAAILDIISAESNLDVRELSIRNRYREDYDYIREYLYPELRVVSFRFSLHRRDMVKDTIHTTVIDDYYVRGMDLLERRKYKEALVILSDYNDYNTAICLMSLGYDNRALEILMEAADESNRNYLLAILATRLRREEEAVRYLMRSVEQDETKIYRGRLDPEINRLITAYGLFNEQL